jgi:hypothetical protein
MSADTTSGATWGQSTKSDLAAQTPPTIQVRCSRLGSAGHVESAVRGPFEGCLDQAKRHCRVVARSISHRFGVAACCDLVGASGAPIISSSCQSSAGGAA